jgi:Leucine-rich repeat (LRR) protein
MIGFFFVNRELAGYNLTGSILDSGIQNLTELTILWLENNALTESVPNLSALTKLQQL